MSERKHTQGPWTTEGQTSVFGPDGLSLAHTKPSHSGYDEARANALLIAAAPDLLEALEYLEYTCYDELEEIYPAMLAALELARAAITKAKGE